MVRFLGYCSPKVFKILHLPRLRTATLVFIWKEKKEKKMKEGDLRFFHLNATQPWYWRVQTPLGVRDGYHEIHRDFFCHFRLSLLQKYFKRDSQIARSRQAKCCKIVEFFSSYHAQTQSSNLRVWDFLSTKRVIRWIGTEKFCPMFVEINSHRSTDRHDPHVFSQLSSSGQK